MKKNLGFELKLVKIMANFYPTEPNIELDLYLTMTYPHQIWSQSDQAFSSYHPETKPNAQILFHYLLTRPTGRTRLSAYPCGSFKTKNGVDPIVPTFKLYPRTIQFDICSP